VVYVIALEEPPFKFQGKLEVQVTPPLNVSVSPPDKVVELHVFEQPVMPGACFHGAVVEVPALVSAPLAKST
jgi:hypothetical protein